MRFTRIAWTALALVGSTVARADGPFGLEMGMTVAQLERIAGPLERQRMDTYVLYATKRPPKPHGAFEEYGLLVDPKTGLCKVIAQGKTIATDGYGVAVRTAYGELRKALSAKYGPGEETNALRQGSMWDEPAEWMTGLLKEERRLSTAWRARRGAALPSRLASVVLRVDAPSSDHGRVTVIYEFQNFREVRDEPQAPEDSAL